MNSSSKEYLFSKIVGNLSIPEHVTSNPISDNVSDAIIKLNVKLLVKHPNVLTIGECNVKKKNSLLFPSQK